MRQREKKFQEVNMELENNILNRFVEMSKCILSVFISIPGEVKFLENLLFLKI